MRANIGCGSIRPEGWDNFDHAYGREDIDSIKPWNVLMPWRECHLYWNDYVGIPDIKWDNYHPGAPDPFPPVVDRYEYAVCSFMLQELDHHQIPGALENMMRILKPGGVLRVLVPDVLRAIKAYYDDEESWFPQDDRTGDLDAKFCTYLTWFGESRSVFTPNYLHRLLEPHGEVHWVAYEATFSPWAEITALDSRPKEAMIMEVTKP